MYIFHGRTRLGPGGSSVEQDMFMFVYMYYQENGRRRGFYCSLQGQASRIKRQIRIAVGSEEFVSVRRFSMFSIDRQDHIDLLPSSKPSVDHW